MLSVRVILGALGATSLGACVMPSTAPPVTPQGIAGRPLDTLPSGFDPAVVRQDLLATAADRFGSAALTQARGASTYLLVKRFAGMAPPPPPGAGPDWTPPTPAALLMRSPTGWMVATTSGWRTADPAAAAELDAIVTDTRFWNEPSYTPPCPDFGASLLMLKAPGRAETIRNSTCMSYASRAVEAALRA